MAIIDTLHLIGSPDTNKVMAGELSRLARRALATRPPEPRKQGRGGLIYPFEPGLAAVAARYQRTATRVLWDLYSSRAARLEPLYDELVADVAADDRAWYRDGGSISVDARNVAGFAAGERQIVGTVKNAILDGAAARGVELRVDPEAPDAHVVARMHDDTLSVSIDLGGGSLSRRGYRQRHGAAPLREHLAAVLCMLARYEPRADVLVDPMCGAGTICIEAALMAQAAPLRPAEPAPALARIPALASVSFPLMGQPLFADTVPRILGNDMDASACEAARANARDAGLAESLTMIQGDARALTVERVNSLLGADGAKGLILSNPPYGQRLGDRAVTALYRDLADWCGQFRGWRAAFLVANDTWASAFGRRPRIQKPLRNGPIHAYFYLYEL